MLKWLAAAAALCIGGAAQAAFTLTIREQAGAVIASGAGTLNLAGLARNSRFDQSGMPFIQPATATIWTGSGDGRFYDAAFVGPGGWGPGAGIFDGAGSGDVVYFNQGGLLGVSGTYVSGALLNSSATFAGQTFASMGLVAGTYAYLFGSGANADRFTVDIVAPPPSSAVPEPATWAMMGAGFALVGAALRRRRANVPAIRLR